MEQHGVQPDFVVGTSIGALIGALYASGHPARVVDSLARNVSLERLFGVVATTPAGWGELTPLLVWEQGDQGLALTSTVVREAEVMALLNALLLEGNLRAGGDFDSLPIPFRAIATDLASREVVILARGDLTRAVRASTAIPVVFTPVRLGGRVLSDGGLSANVPVGVARHLGARRVVVSDVSADRLEASELSSPLAVVEQLSAFLFTQTRDTLGARDVYIRPDVRGVNSLDFSRATVARLVDAGRAAADSTLQGVGCIPPRADRAGSVPRAAWTLGAVEGRGLAAADVAALRRQLGLQRGAPLDPALLASRIRLLAEHDAVRELWLNPAGGDTVRLFLEATRAPRRTIGLDLAYDNELGGRMGVGALDRALLGTGTEATATLTLGRFVKEASLGLRRYAGARRSRVAPTLTLDLRQVGIRRFLSDGVEIPEEETREAVAFLGIERGVHEWLVRLGVDGRVWHTDPGNDASLGVAMALAHMPRGGGVTFDLGALWSETARFAHVTAAAAITSGQVTVRPRARLGVGSSLPSHLTMSLAGPDGFPGLHIGERRGDREVLLATRTEWTVLGPVALAVEVAAGRVGTGGSPLAGDQWVGGVRAGVSAGTPIGPIRAEYGLVTTGRGAVLIRVGRWF